DEGVGILVDLGDDAAEPGGGLVDIEHGHAGQELAQLDELARVAGREHQRPRHATTRRWIAVSWRMPSVARSSIASSCLRSNVPCSAVPWTSISAPSSPPTTFMSTSARESSV